MLVVPPVAVTDRVVPLTLVAGPVDRTLHVLLALTPAGGGRQDPGQDHQAPRQLGLDVRLEVLSELGLVHQHQVWPECFMTLEVEI